MSKYSKYFSFLRCIITLCALFWVFKMINVRQIFTVLSNVNLTYVFIAFFLSFLIRCIVSYRWSVLLQTQGYQMSPLRLLKITVVSDAIGTFMPSNLSREGIKAFMLWKYIRKGADSLSSIGIDRFSGLVALTGIALVCSVLSYRTLNDQKFIVVSGILFGLCILLPVMLLWVRKSGKIEFSSLSKIRYFEKIFQSLSDILESLLKFGKDKRVLLKVQAVSIVVQFLRIFFIFFMALALGVNVALIHFCVFLPIIMLVLMLPISIGGLGVQEAAFIFFFTPLGMKVEEAVGLSLLCYTAVILWMLIGWGIYAKEGLWKNSGGLKDNASFLR